MLIQLLTIILLTLTAKPFPEANQHSLTIVNNIAELDIISLYIWGTDQSSKGENRIGSILQPDSSVTFTIPSGKCNILAFDELDNSYEIQGTLKKNTQDTLEIDLEYMTFAAPNFDHGHYPLHLKNSLPGFALDRITLSSPQLDQDIVIDNHRVFPGNNINIWLDKGIYSIIAVDQIDRAFSTEGISVPDDSCIVSISESMICNPVVPIGITGSGSGALLIENCLPWTPITELRIPPDDNFEGIYLDDLSLQPGTSIVIELDPGMYELTISDEHGWKYSLLVALTDSNTTRISITSDFLDFDFSFPERPEQ